MSRRREAERAERVPASKERMGDGKLVRVADMSLPPDRRGRPRRTTRRRRHAKPAQLDHGNSSRADKLRATGAAKDRKHAQRRRAT